MAGYLPLRMDGGCFGYTADYNPVLFAVADVYVEIHRSNESHRGHSEYSLRDTPVRYRLGLQARLGSSRITRFARRGANARSSSFSAQSVARWNLADMARGRFLLESDPAIYPSRNRVWTCKPDRPLGHHRPRGSHPHV